MNDDAHSLFSDVALDHAQHPRHLGLPARFNGCARLSGSCGDVMAVWVYVNEGVVQEVAFVTDGCGTSTSAGSMTTCLALGQPVAQVLELRQVDVLNALGRFPEEAEHCAELSADTVRAACEDYLSRGRHEPPAVPLRIAVPTVDGAVATECTGREGFALIGVDPQTSAIGFKQELPPPADHEPLPTWLAEHGVGLLIACQMDDRLAESVADRGIDVALGACKGTPERLVVAWLLGVLKADLPGRCG